MVGEGGWVAVLEGTEVVQANKTKEFEAKRMKVMRAEERRRVKGCTCDGRAVGSQGGKNATSIHPLHPPLLVPSLPAGLFSCFLSMRIWEEPKEEGRQDVVSLVFGRGIYFFQMSKDLPSSHTDLQGHVYARERG